LRAYEKSQCRCGVHYCFHGVIPLLAEYCFLFQSAAQLARCRLT
jgi:hypothetical protein